MNPAKQKRALVVTADDVGLTRGINEGVEELIRAGRLLNVSVMVNTPAFDHAVGILKKQPQVSCGLHFNIYQGRPLTNSPGLRPILDSDGRFRRSLFRLFRALKRPDVISAVREELKAQLDLFETSGLTPSHIDAHKFIVYTPVIAMSAELAAEKGIPSVRLPLEPPSVARRFLTLKTIFSKGMLSSLFISRFARQTAASLKGVRTIPCAGIFCIGEWTIETMEGVLAAGEENAMEVVMHPGRVCDQLRNDHTRLLHQREEEIEILLSDRFGSLLEQHGWRIAGFRDLVC